MEGGASVLVVDDDAVIRTLVRGLLEKDGHRVTEAPTAEEAIDAISAAAPDLLVLDVRLPEMSGIEFLLRMRDQLHFPVILMTGEDAESDRVVGLDLGADDYVVKPFLPREFGARVRAVLRRARPADSPEQAAGLNFGKLEIRPAEREVLVDGAVVELTVKEFDLIHYLAVRPRQAVSREELLARVWGSSEGWQDPATVTEHVRRLRRKVERDPDDPRHLQTVRGVGYRFEP